MSVRKTAMLFALLVILCLGYALMVHLERRGRNAQEVAKKLFAFPPEDIAGMEIARIGEAPVAAAREKDAPWKMVKPNPAIEANQVLWNRVAAAFAGLANERTLETSPEEAATFKLDNPLLTISADTIGGQQARVHFGAVDPTQSYRYAQQENGPVFLAPLKAFQEMDRPLDLLRNPYAFTIGEAGVTRFEFSRYWKKKGDTPAAETRAPGEESVVVALEKSPDGIWRLRSPIEAQANQERVNELIQNLQYATGRSYIDTPEALDRYGLEPAAARVTLFSGAGSEGQTLYFGGPEAGSDKKAGGVYVKHAARPAVFVIDAQILTLLPKTPDALREARLFTGQATALRSIHYVTRDTDVTLDNDEQQGWKMTAPKVDDVDPLAVTNFIAFLKALEGHAFPGDRKPQFGLDNPMISIAFTFKPAANGAPAEKDTPPSRILVGGPVPETEQYYASTDTGIVTILNALEVSALTKTVFDFRNKKLLAFDKNGLAQISVDIEGVHYVFENPRGHSGGPPAGQWRLKEPADRSLGSASDLTALVDALSPLYAAALENETAPADLAPFGIEAPVAAITVTTPGPAKDPASETVLGPVKIGSPAADNSQQRFATVAGRPGLYRIQQSVVDTIREVVKGIH